MFPLPGCRTCSHAAALNPGHAGGCAPPCRTHSPAFISLEQLPPAPLLAAGAQRISAQRYIFWLLSLPPACCCFLRQFLKGGSIPQEWPAHSQEPRRTDLTPWPTSCCVLGVWAQPHGPTTHGELWERKRGPGLFFFFCLAFFRIL